MRNQGVAAQELTEYYLVNLLSDFLATPVDLQTPFAVRLAEVMAAEPAERADKLREIGDASLYISGFFAEAATRRSVDVGYYIAVGRTAYGHLASLAAAGRPRPSARTFAEAFGELADKFHQFVDVLMEISEQSSAASNGGLVRQYERWLRTRSPYIAKKLKAEGLHVLTPGKSDVVH
jgi:hypothetical protein